MFPENETLRVKEWIEGETSSIFSRITTLEQNTKMSLQPVTAGDKGEPYPRSLAGIAAAG